MPGVFASKIAIPLQKSSLSCQPLFLCSWTAPEPKCFRNLSGHRCSIFSAVGYLYFIMADEHKKSEFLGGGPKFNTVGKDVRGKDEVIVPDRQNSHWLRIILVGLVIAVLAGALFYLNARTPGRSVVPGGHGGKAITPDERPSTPSDPNLR